MDYIRREDLREEMVVVPSNAYEQGWNDALRSVYRNALSVDSWIPVSVRLPEDGQSVNVTIQGNHVVYVTTATWDEMRRCFYNLGLPFRDVVAWCKLPEPYKAEKEVSE